MADVADFSIAARILAITLARIAYDVRRVAEGGIGVGGNLTQNDRVWQDMVVLTRTLWHVNWLQRKIGPEIILLVPKESAMIRETLTTPPERLSLMTAREAANYLRVSLSTLHRMELRGALIPLRTPGGHKRYTLDMLNECLDQYELKNTSTT